MVAVLYELAPLEDGCGGTVKHDRLTTLTAVAGLFLHTWRCVLQAVISGSHRPDYRRPVFSRADGTAKPPWPDDFGTEVVTVQPGDALIFSEKLLHSTAMYTGSGQRRTLFCARPALSARARLPTCWLRAKHLE